MTTGAWIREVIEAAISKQNAGDDLVPMSVQDAGGRGFQELLPGPRRPPRRGLAAKG
jgi:hypothetical protein